MITERMKREIHEKGYSMQEFAELCGLPLETIRNIYYGKTSDPKLSTALKIAEACNISVNCLVGKCSDSPAERAILASYRACGTHGQSMIKLIARYEAKAARIEKESRIKHIIPCLCPQGDMRKGIVYDLCDTSEVETNVSNAYLGIKMTSNELSPIYCKGDIVLFEDRFPTNGERAAFFRTDRVYIRKFYEEDDHYRLKCLHRHGEDIILRRMDEVEYLGTCVGVVRS